jgi:hypothetical protein
MDPRKLFVDERLSGSCVYCGGVPDSRDHVPSKVLLDDPLPPDLPVVEACSTCNGNFSLDEEYLACFLECVLSGSTSPESLSRPKIKSILARKVKLARRIQSCCWQGGDGSLTWEPEERRVRNVVLKLARGHAAFELSLPQIEEPDEVWVLPFATMSGAECDAFENTAPGEVRGWPEVGSRAFVRASGAKPYAGQAGPWVVVQANRYRYSVDQDDGVRVQMVLSEYLVCSVNWS